MTNKNKKLYVREFLNKEGFHSIGLILASVDNWKKDYEDVDSRWVDYPGFELTIGDCSRQISLDFDMSSEKSIENDLHKLDILYNTIKEVRSLYKRYAKKRLVVLQEIEKKKKEKKEKDAASTSKSDTGSRES